MQYNVKILTLGALIRKEGLAHVWAPNIFVFYIYGPQTIVKISINSRYDLLPRYFCKILTVSATSLWMGSINRHACFFAVCPPFCIIGDWTREGSAGDQMWRMMIGW